MIINATGGGGLKRLIKNDDSITVALRGNNRNYFDTTYGIKAAYSENGDVILFAKTGSASGGATVNFSLGSVPSGVAIAAYGKSTTKQTVSCCFLSGVASPVEATATITVNSPWSTSQPVTVNIVINLA